MEFANTPKPPYFAVIFTSIQSENIENYQVIVMDLRLFCKRKKSISPAIITVASVEK